MSLEISADKLLCWSDLSAKRWLEFLLAYPAILALPSDIRQSTTVADTFQHIFAVELRYAQRLSGLPESPYREIPVTPVNELFVIHDRAFSLVRDRLADSSYAWSECLTFDTMTAGRMRSTREAILLHITFHSIRHYAQLGTLVRQQGYQPTWAMDYLYTDMQPA